MYYVTIDPNINEGKEKLYLLRDKNGNVVDKRFATNRNDAINVFLSNHKELRRRDIEYMAEDII